jgi:hypothetical protein
MPLPGFAVRSGVRAVVCSTWVATDQAQALLFSRFYEELGRSPDVSVAEALRIGQVRIIREELFSHPVYWAPFVVIGAPEPTVVRNVRPVSPVAKLRQLERLEPDNLGSVIMQARSLEPDDLIPIDLLTVGEYLVLGGDCDAAIKLIERAIQAGGTDPFYSKALGWALLRRGDVARAEREFATAMSRRASSTTRATTQPATQPASHVDAWTAAFLAGRISQDEYLERWEFAYSSLVWFYIGEKADIDGKREEALLAYQTSARKANSHRSAGWAAYRIRQMTGASRPTSGPASLRVAP